MLIGEHVKTQERYLKAQSTGKLNRQECNTEIELVVFTDGKIDLPEFQLSPYVTY